MPNDPHAPQGAQPQPRALPKRPYKHRSSEQLYATLSMLTNFVWTKQLRSGEHLWSIPVDDDRDFDCILYDAVAELLALRAEIERLRIEIGETNLVIEQQDRDLERMHAIRERARAIFAGEIVGCPQCGVSGCDEDGLCVACGATTTTRNSPLLAFILSDTAPAPTNPDHNDTRRT